MSEIPMYPDEPVKLSEDALRTALTEACDRIRVLEDALEEAINAVRHAKPSVDALWLSSLEKKLRPNLHVGPLSPGRQDAREK